MSRIFRSVEAVRDFFDDDANKLKLGSLVESKKLVDVKQLSGGYLNKVFRVRFDDNSTLIFKYYPATIDYETPMDYSQDRYFIEKAALELLGNEQCMRDCKLRTPKCLYSDDALFVLIMEDCGERLVSLSELLRTDLTSIDTTLKSDLLDQLADELNAFYKNLFNNCSIKYSTHANVFANRITWDFLNTYYVQIYKEQAKLYGVEREMAPYIEAHKVLEEPKSDAFFSLGDLWPNSIMFDVDSRIIWCIDWEMARFEKRHRDIEQLFTNLWVMKQDAVFYDAQLCERLMRRLQREFFGADDADWRLHCDGETMTEFILMAAALLAEPHIKRRDSQLLLTAIREVEMLRSNLSV